MASFNLRRLIPLMLLAVYLVTASGCASKTGGTALGAGIGAIVGGVAGYAIAGEKGALVGAGAGAVIGGGLGYTLSKKKETQVATETQVQQQAVDQGAPILDPVLEIRDLALTPSTPAPGEEVLLDVNLRAVSGTKRQVDPPAIKVSMSRDGRTLREQELVAENTGDVAIQSAFKIPKAAEAGVYTVSVQTVPQANLPSSSKQATFEVKELPPVTTQQVSLLRR